MKATSAKDYVKWMMTSLKGAILSFLTYTTACVKYSIANPASSLLPLLSRDHQRAPDDVDAVAIC